MNPLNIIQGALPLWRWRGCKAPKTPYFQRCCHPMTPYFCWLSLLSPKCEMWALRSLSPKDPLCFAFGYHRALLFFFLLFFFFFFFSISKTNGSFLPFSTIFFQIPAFRKRSLKIKSNILTQCPLILNQNLASYPMTPDFFRLCSHRMPQPLEVWALHPYLFHIGVPPPSPIDDVVNKIPHKMKTHWQNQLKISLRGPNWMLLAHRP